MGFYPSNETMRRQQRWFYVWILRISVGAFVIHELLSRVV